MMTNGRPFREANWQISNIHVQLMGWLRNVNSSCAHCWVVELDSFMRKNRVTLNWRDQQFMKQTWHAGALKLQSQSASVGSG